MGSTDIQVRRACKRLPYKQKYETKIFKNTYTNFRVKKNNVRYGMQS